MAEVFRNGLTQLSRGSNVDADGVKFNIVFIHGLRGHPQKTWEGPKAVKFGGETRKGLFGSFRRSQSVATEANISKVFWPRDLLAKDIPQATIWTYGYNANVIGLFEANNQNSVYQHGQDLKIALERDIDNEYPMVFIVHSLGGIVLKNALSRSERCQARTKLIMFLGTPHRGSPAASMGQTAAKLASLALQDSNRDVLRSLKTDNKALNDIHEEFVKIVLDRSIAVHSFQEARGMTGIRGLSGKVVDDFSSKLDLPTIESVESIDADHRQMARCSRREDETYRKIVSELKSRTRNGLFKPNQEVEPLSIPENNQQMNTPRNHLQIPKPRKNHQPKSGQHQERHVHMPFVPNLRFVGREEKLEELERRLLIDKDAQRLAIVGLGGIGKTQLARAFCYIVKEHYVDFSILWVSAISNATFRQDFRSIAQKYSIVSSSEGEQQLLDVRDFLSTPASGKWLLIIDNADDTNLLRDKDGGILKYLPQSETGLTLFTTRYKELADLADYNIVDLEEMNFKEGFSFLKKFLQREYLTENQAMVKEFLEELAYLPLAIVQASAYIIKNSITISAYLALIRTTEKEMVHLLSQDFYDNTRSKGSHNAVAVTWLVSFDQIRSDEPAAADILYFLAFLENKGIPLSILPPTEPKSKLTRAIGVLVGCSFLSKQGDENNDVYDMHRLVHRAIKIWMEKENLVTEWEQKVVSHLAEIFPWCAWDDMKLIQQYIPHTTRVLQNSRDTDQRARLSMKLGDGLLGDCRYAEATKWLSEGISWMNRILPEIDRDKMYFQQTLGMAYCRNGQASEAIELLEKALAFQVTLLAEDDPARIDTESVLAEAYYLDEHVDKAIEILERICALQAKFLEENDSSRLSAQHALAIAYHDDGKIEKTIEILEKIVACEAQIRAKDEPNLLASQFTLAQTYEANGQLDKAVSLMQHVATVTQASFRPDHPHRLLTEEDLSRMQSLQAQSKNQTQRTA